MALALPPAVRERLATWAGAALGPDAAVRPVPAANLHVTLVFLGSRDVDLVPAIAQAALAGVPSLAAPALAPAGLTGVPTRRPRLFAAELDDAGGRATAVAAAVERGLVHGGFHEPEERPFWPHVTLARVRKGERPREPSADAMPAEPFTASEVVLYRSIPDARSVRYEPLASERLAT